MAFLPLAVWPLKFARRSSEEYRLDEKSSDIDPGKGKQERRNFQFLTVSAAGAKKDGNIEYFNAVVAAFSAPVVKCIHYTVCI